MQISVSIKVLTLKILTEIIPTIVNLKNLRIFCPNESFKLKLTLIQVYVINLLIHSFSMLR